MCYLGNMPAPGAFTYSSAVREWAFVHERSASVFQVEVVTAVDLG